MTNLRDRLSLFPDTAKIDHDSLKIAGHDLSALASTYGTPLYVYDRATMDACAVRYREALKAHYPAASAITYAAKAFLCKAVAQWTVQQKLWLDCTGEGEVAVAVAGGVPATSIVVHGANKSAADLDAAVQHAGTIAVDNLAELERVTGLFKRHVSSAQPAARFPSLWLRLQPGLQVHTHHPYTQTGNADSKFGMTAQELVQAAVAAKSADLPLNGVHFHLGSNFRDTAPLVPAIDLALKLVHEIGFPETWHFCAGGGWGVAYHEDELPQPDIEAYVRVIARSVIKRCRSLELPLPTLHLEPGRSLVARAGVALYRVGAVKKRGTRTWLLADGGMADNPRHALYGSKYSCLTVTGVGRAMSERVSIAGPYCESGDVIIEDVRLPDVEEGELIAIPVSGAYHLSMSSNYNGARRPAVVWLEKGRARLIRRSETLDDLLERDLSIT
jgi:diaminopimelate decarboxylase